MFFMDTLVAHSHVRSFALLEDKISKCQFVKSVCGLTRIIATGFLENLFSIISIVNYAIFFRIF